MAKNKKASLILQSISFTFLSFFVVSCGLIFADRQVQSTEQPETPDNGNINGYRVTEVIDGDTIIVSGGACIRLIGINAPEEGRYFYDESKQVLKTILENKTVSLESDITDKDMYGRFLRYVWFERLFVNLEMVKRGFANVFTVAPDIKYDSLFLSAEREARKTGKGLWKISEYSAGDNFENFEGESSAGEVASRDGIGAEIEFDAQGNDNNNLNGEFVRFFNNTGTDINIGGWTVKDAATNIYEFNDFPFKNGTSIMLFSGSGSDSGNNFYWNRIKPVWNNDSDTLYLRDSMGYLVLVCSY